MKVGLLVNPNAFTADPATFAQRIESLGFESFWAGDHIAIPKDIKTHMPNSGRALPESYRLVSDPFVVLSVATSVTTTLRLGTGLSIVANRSPIVTALEAAAVERLSGGRFLFGVRGLDPRAARRTRWRLPAAAGSDARVRRGDGVLRV